ncbi:MAG: hypothetical protein ACR2HG_04185 [Pyrinomonadaceae bacterium]
MTKSIVSTATVGAFESNKIMTFGKTATACFSILTIWALSKTRGAVFKQTQTSFAQKLSAAEVSGGIGIASE